MRNDRIRAPRHDDLGVLAPSAGRVSTKQTFVGVARAQTEAWTPLTVPQLQARSRRDVTTAVIARRRKLDWRVAAAVFLVIGGLTFAALAASGRDDSLPASEPGAVTEPGALVEVAPRELGMTVEVSSGAVVPDTAGSDEDLGLTITVP